ncbi:MAG: ExeM/NucH family extracellular endonuclease [Anaerolineae bacterium]|nr:ExeM/NucH family extracellular endonuclease [Anaerolineae bacterium]
MNLINVKRNGRLLLLTICLALLSGLLSQTQPVQAASTTVVISEFRVRGPNGAADEFVELYNLSTEPVDISGWLIRGSNNAAGVSTRATIAAATVLNPGCYYLITNASTSGGPYSGAVPGDQTFTTGITDDGGIALTLPNGTTIIDQVGMSNGSAYKEGTPLTSLGSSNLDRGYERKPGGAAGSGTDTDDNSTDFQLLTPSDPQNSASPCVSSEEPEPTAPIINEFVLNHVGTDTHEFVEIYGDPNTDYSDYTILQIEGDTTGAGLIDSVHIVGTTNADGLWTTGFLTNVFENGTVTLLLVKDFTGTIGQDLDSNNDGLFDVTPWSSLVDDVAVNDGGAGDTTYSTTVLAPGFGGSPFTPGGASRIPNGVDTDSAADWALNDFDGEGLPGFIGTPDPGEAFNTPGAPNALVTVNLGYLVISQVYGGGGNAGAPYTHDFIELYNASSSPININGWSVQYTSAAGTSWQVTPLSGTVAPGSYYLIQQAAGNSCAGLPCGSPLPTPNATGTSNMSGTVGKVALVNNSTALSGACPTGGAIVDFVGYGGTANCFEGSGPTPALSNTTAALRKDGGNQDTDDNAADFEVGPPNPRSTPTVDEAPEVTSTVPANGAIEVSLTTNIIINFSEPVNVTGSWFTIACSSGSYTASVTGGPVSFTLDPDNEFDYGDNCTVTILASQVTDVDDDDPPDNMVADYSFSFTTVAVDVCESAYTPIYTIQGSGLSTPLAGQTVSTLGVVVGDYEGPSPTLRGFYIQDPFGDGDPTTSDGIFVFNFDNDSVNLGDLVRVTGTAAEFQDQTQISSVTSIVSCGTGSVAPVDITLPFPSADYLERYEGMLIRLPQTLYVTEHFQLGRFGQIVMSADGRLAQPTNVVAPGAPALALQEANNLNRIIVDDAWQNQNPDPIVFGRDGQPLSASNTLRGGDTATNIVGILTYTWAGNAASGNAYRVRPVNVLGGSLPEFVPANPRPMAPESVGGTLKVAGFNLLNYFNTFSGCTNGVGGPITDCRGAENALEFERQWQKTVAAIIGLDADVLGVIEIENDGYGPTSALQDLVDRLNAAAGPGTYAFIDVDAATGEINALGTDAIKVGLIYRPANVTPVGQTAVLNSVSFVNGGDPAPRNRPSLTQAFAQNSNGAIFIVNVNHLKSKGSACSAPDAGDGQGNCNVVRTNAVNELMSWLASDPTGTGDPDILIIGDLNAYAKEDPITALINGGYTNLIESLLGPDAYSYVFDGQWGYLDHALASASLVAQISGITEWHINADEPNVLDYNTNFKSPGQIASLYAPDQYRVSDHDPILIGLNLNVAPFVNAGGPYLVNEGGSVIVTAAGFDPDGGDLLYEWDLNNDGVFETVGQSAVFSAALLAAPSSHPIRVRVTDEGGLWAVDETVVHVTYNFTGFFSPIVNLPAINLVTAGSAVPIKFSLNGYKGMAIFAPGSPTSQLMSCAAGTLENDIQVIETPGNSGLQYDAATDTYTYVWKTHKAWKGTCRQLVVQLNDGTIHRANFRFK